MRRILQHARRLGQYNLDPAVVVPNWPANYQPRKRWLRQDEATALVDRIDTRFGPDRAAHISYFLGTGARAGEVDRATRGDVVNDFIHIRGTKTDDSDRIIPVTAVMKPWLDRALRDAPGKNGNPLFRVWHNLNRDLNLAYEDIRIACCSPNDLRRTVASWHLHAGMSSELVRHLLGHRSTAMLDRVYGRHNEHTLRDLMRDFLPPDEDSSEE